MLDRVVNILSSLRLSVVLLALALGLVFAGTLAQVNLGLYAVQARFFHSFFIYWIPADGHLKIPIFPGGWLIGLLLLVNLLAAHIKRFKFSLSKIGLIIIHVGLVLLLLGQFLTERFQVESQMRLENGVPMSYAEDSRRNELAVIDVTDPDRDSVISIPQSLLEKEGEIHPAGLPFTLRVERFLPNSSPTGPMSGGSEKIKASNGIGHLLFFSPAPTVTRSDDENKPAALVEILADRRRVGEWTVSTWLTKHPWVSLLQEQAGSLLSVPVDAPQGFSVNGRKYELALRPVRYYKPYTITLQQFKHEVYAGTDIPRNFASKIHLRDPARGEDRDVLIYMNNPLRYRGESFYQASFESGDTVSILQVVRNPASVTPYVACSLMGIGMVVQFLTHLYRFARKRSQPARAPAAMPAPALVPVGGDL